MVLGHFVVNVGDLDQAIDDGRSLSLGTWWLKKTAKHSSTATCIIPKSLEAFHITERAWTRQGLGRTELLNNTNNISNGHAVRTKVCWFLLSQRLISFLNSKSDDRCNRLS